MTDKSKLMLSAEELQLVTNTGWILTKRKLTDDVNIFFANLAVKMKGVLLQEIQWLPETVISSAPKIVKGENYLEMPYVLLDYPRCFDKENIFAVRTMFWWGNFFSCTLHLSGSYKKMFQQVLQKNIAPLQKNKFYICVNESEWQHHFKPDNFTPANTLKSQEIKSIIVDKPFIKVAAKFTLHQWSEIDVLLEKCFADIINLLKD